MRRAAGFAARLAGVALLAAVLRVEAPARLAGAAFFAVVLRLDAVARFAGAAFFAAEAVDFFAAVARFVVLLDLVAITLPCLYARISATSSPVLVSSPATHERSSSSTLLAASARGTRSENRQTVSQFDNHFAPQLAVLR